MVLPKRKDPPNCGRPLNSWLQPIQLGQQAGTSFCPLLDEAGSTDHRDSVPRTGVSLHTGLLVLKLGKSQADCEGKPRGAGACLCGHAGSVGLRTKLGTAGHYDISVSHKPPSESQPRINEIRPL